MIKNIISNELSRYLLAILALFLFASKAIFDLGARAEINSLLGKKFYKQNSHGNFLSRYFYIIYRRVLAKNTVLGIYVLPFVGIIDVLIAILTIFFDIEIIEVSLFTISVILISLSIVKLGIVSASSTKKAKGKINSALNTLIIVVLIWIFWGYFLYEYLTSFILGFTSDFYVGNAIALGLEALDGKMEG